MNKSKLLYEIKILTEHVENLNKRLENQDMAIKILSDEKEELHLEVKSVQLTNKNLKQELDDEREIRQKEKEYFIQAIKKFSENPDHADKDLLMVMKNVNYKDKKPEHNNLEMVQQLKIKDEVILNICRKYMKISYIKKRLKNRIFLLQHQTEKMCANIISLLQENQETIDTLINKLLVSVKVAPNGKNYLNDIKSYGQLHYENMQLKIAILSFDPINNVLGKNRAKNKAHKNRNSRNANCNYLLQSKSVTCLDQ